VEAEAVGDLAHLRARGVDVEPAAGGLLVPEHDVLGDGEHRDQHEVLVDHADPCGHRVTGTREVLHLVVEQDLALVRLVQAVQHVHECRLAGAVLPQEAVDLTGLDREVDVVVRHQCAEAFGDAAQLELHVRGPRVGLSGGQG